MSQINLSCREASRLLSASRDRKLGVGERVSLRLHLGLCKACTRFSRQLDFLSEAMKRYPVLDDDTDPKRGL